MSPHEGSMAGVAKDLLSSILGWLYSVIAALSQSATNGTSLLGSLQALLLPLFLTNNPLPNGYPWGTSTTTNTNPYTNSPTTGVTRTYDFTISRGVLAPDGYQKNVLLVNGGFPGPTIEANWGDRIVVTVHNNITGPTEGTAMHWHGFLQTGTPWYDGTPGISACPIPPGKSLTYDFKAELYGTTWYHSHYSAQYSGGVSGPMVVYGPLQSSYDIDIGPVMLSDWYHTDYNTLVAQTLAKGGNGLVFSDNNLINGKMNFNCSTVATGDKTKCTNNAGISKFKFTTGKTHRLRLINSGSEGTQRFSIDGHTLTIIANDFVPVTPYNTTVVTLGVGQRTDVLVTANVGHSGSSYWMRSNLTSCSLANQPLAVAAIFYDGADTNKAPTSTAWNVPDPGTCTNDDLSLTKPLYKMPLPPPSTSHTYPVALYVNSTGSTVWSFDGISERTNYNQPTLLLANAGNTSFPAEWNVRNLGTNSSVRMVVQNSSPAAHPIHLHGNNFYVLHEGAGTWDGTTIVNAGNPQRRDVQMVRANGHLALQFDSVNPGLWPFHCHIAWHAGAGFFLQFVVQPDRIKGMTVPAAVTQQCRDWWAYSNVTVVTQIDSGE